MKKAALGVIVSLVAVWVFLVGGPKTALAATKCATDIQCVTTPTLWAGCEKNPDNAYECIYSAANSCWTNLQCTVNPSMSGCAGGTCKSVVGTVVNTVANAGSSTSSTGTWYNQSFPEFFTKVYDPSLSSPNEIFGERYTAAQVQWVVYGLGSFVINLAFGNNSTAASCFVKMAFDKTVDPSTCLSGLANALTLGNPPSLNQSALAGGSASMWQDVFKDRQLSGITDVRNIFRRFSVVPEVNAAGGFGLAHLLPISDIWKVTRNFAFLIFTVVFIVASFMIMFRRKISPQAVITFQYILPKIVIAMLAVTFSLTMAGFLIDLIYVLSGIAATVIASSPISPESGPAGVYNIIIGTGSGAITIVGFMVEYLILFVVSTIMAIFASITNLAISSFIFSFLLLLFTIILIIIVIINFFKILFGLFKCLAEFYLLVIIGPVQLALSPLLPNFGLGPYLIGLFSRLLVFPVTGIFMALSLTFLIEAINVLTIGAIPPGLANVMSIHPAGQISGDFWTPPILGEGRPASGLAFIFISLSIFLLIPKIKDAIAAMFAGKQYDYGSAIGEAAKSPVRSAGEIGDAIGRSVSSALPSTPFGPIISGISSFIGGLGR